jgi:hypothetical protein
VPGAAFDEFVARASELVGWGAGSMVLVALLDVNVRVIGWNSLLAKETKEGFTGYNVRHFLGYIVKLREEGIFIWSQLPLWEQDERCPLSEDLMEWKR